MLGAGKADLAIGRGDLSMPADAQTLAVLRKNYVVLWAPSGRSGKNSNKKAAGNIGEITDLAGHKVGIIGNTGANLALLRTILEGSGTGSDKVAMVQFATEETEKLAQDATLDAYLAVGPLDSKITVAAIAATSRSRGAPKFLPVDTSEAIALKHPRYEAEEIPGGVFNAKPAWPEDKVDTISVNHLILTRKSLSEAKAAAFYRQLFTVRDTITQRVAGAAHITKPDTEKEAEPSVHRGTAAVINGTERTFLDKYSDYFWFALLLLSGIGSAAAWLRRYLNRDDRDDNTGYRNRILSMVSEVRGAEFRKGPAGVATRGRRDHQRDPQVLRRGSNKIKRTWSHSDSFLSYSIMLSRTGGRRCGTALLIKGGRVQPSPLADSRTAGQTSSLLQHGGQRRTVIQDRKNLVARQMWGGLFESIAGIDLGAPDCEVGIDRIRAGQREEAAVARCGRPRARRLRAVPLGRV